LQNALVHTSLAILIAAAALPASAAEGDLPVFERSVVSSHEQLASNCYPCLARLDDGRLLVVWSALKGSRIVGAHSGDCGRSWADLIPLIDTKTGRDYDPSIIVSGKRVFVTSTTTAAGGGIHASATWCTRSDDNGATWSALCEIPMNHRYTCGKTAHGVRLKSGTLLMGYSWDVLCEEGKTLQSEGEMHLRAGVMRSTDDGATWHNGGDTDAAYQKVSGGAVHGTDEPSIVELDDGSVLMLMRTGSTHLDEARSTDEGETWTRIGPSPLRGTNAPCALCSFQVGERRGILCVWDNATNRYPLCAAASFDGGRTWSWPKDIAGPTGGKQVSYPGCEQAADGALVAVWQQDVEGGRDLRCARFTLAWLLRDPTANLKAKLAGVKLPTPLGEEIRFTGAEIAKSPVWQIHRPRGEAIGGEATAENTLRMATTGCCYIDNKPEVWNRAASTLVEFPMRVLGRALDNVFVERLWRTVKYEEIYLRDYADGREAHARLDSYFHFYDAERRHAALDRQTPATVYFASHDTGPDTKETQEKDPAKERRITNHQ